MSAFPPPPCMPVFLRVGVDVVRWRLRDRRHRVKAQALPLGQVRSVSELSLQEVTLREKSHPCLS